MSDHLQYIGVMDTRPNNQKKGSGRRKQQVLQVRLESGEKEAFEAAANLAGLALSAWVRERLRRIALEELEKAGQPVAFMPDRKGT